MFVLTPRLAATCLLPLLAPVVVAASPLHLGLGSRTFTYTALWNGTGPEITDVAQVATLDCWWDAASVAVVFQSAWWVENLFSLNGATLAGQVNPQESSVTVQLWDPSSLSSHTFTVNVADESATEDHPGGDWWHSALTQGLYQLAATTTVPGVMSNGTFDPSTASGATGLSVLTGFASANEGRSDTVSGGKYTTSIQLWEDLTKCAYTPVLVATIGTVTTTTPQIDANHVYAVLNVTEYQNATRYITVRNPWGATDSFALQDIYDNLYYLHHLQNWQSLVWPSSSSS